jgi:hypothetical protein
MFDLNDVEPINSGELLPDGSFVKVIMAIRPGGVDGDTEIDKGLLKASNAPGSDVLSLDCEFTVTEGPFARRKFWHMFTIAGGKVDGQGASIGSNISKRIFRAMIDSALGVDPEDMSEAAKAKRQLRGLADLDGITFVAKVAVQPNSDSRYPDHNRLDHPVLPTSKEWRAVMNGEDVPPRPSKARAANGSRSAAAAQPPAWGSGHQNPAATLAAPLWQRPVETSAPAPQPAPPATQTAKPSGPAWLNA